MRRIKTKYPRIELTPEQAIELDHIRELLRDMESVGDSISSNLMRYENADGLEDLSDDMGMLQENGRELIELARKWQSFLDRYIARERPRRY